MGLLNILLSLVNFCGECFEGNNLNSVCLNGMYGAILYIKNFRKPIKYSTFFKIYVIIILYTNSKTFVIVKNLIINYIKNKSIGGDRR